MKKIFAFLMVSILCISLCACGNSELKEAAKPVSEAIANIGEVTLEDEQAIAKAQEMYDKLPEEAKAYVKNYADIDKAQQTINEIKINNCIELISQIGEVTIDSKEKIKEAESAYNALSKENKEKVTNIDVLNNAKTTLKSLRQAEADAILSTLRCDEDKVRNMKFYYPRTMKHYSDGSWAADIRCFVLPYLGMDSSSSWLRLLHNYTDDDWVFFEKITYAVDDKRYYKSFKYGETVRDNGGGDVWEYADIEPSDSDIAMLWEIVNSNETIIRFEGDEYTSDFTISAADKEAIKEILTVYEILN